MPYGFTALSLTRRLAQQRLKAARIYAWLSGLAILLVAGIGLAKVVIHFTMKVGGFRASYRRPSHRFSEHPYRLLYPVG